MGKVIKFEDNFNTLPIKDKINNIIELLTKDNLKDLICSLVVTLDDELDLFEIISLVSKRKKYKQYYSYSNLELKSLIIDYLVKKNKTKVIKNYFDSLSKKELKSVLNYEVSHKTPFSHMKLCKNLYQKLVKKIISKKQIEDFEINKVENKNLNQNEKKKDSSSKKNILKKQIKSKKVKVSILTIILIIVFSIGYTLVGALYAILLFYNTHIYPNVYLDGKSIEGETYQYVREYLDTSENKLNDEVELINANDSHIFKYSDIGVIINSWELEKEIIDDYQNLNGFLKLMTIFSFQKKDYEVSYQIDKVKYEKILEDLKSKVNLEKKEESLKLVNGSLVYTKGVNGFTLDTSNLEKLILETIRSDDKKVNLEGTLEKVSNSLSLVNKKVASYTTYYNESQGRAKNIRNAASKINGKIIYPGETFSFYKNAGPYNETQGYVYYGEYVGSGVCQVSTTIYNTQLLLNLPIVSRSNHGEMVYYVDYGMDATVYGNSVDYKFKNNSNYPILIEAVASGGALTVSFWSNENIIEKGYSYKPRSVKVSGLMYRTYLDTYYNDKYIKSTYLNSSYYIKGK